MKLIIAGGREIFPTALTISQIVIELGLYPSLIITGGASGVDMMGKVFAHRFFFNHKEYKAEWLEHGKAAGPIRNREMALDGDELLLIWSGLSIGSADMRRQMLDLGKPVHEIIWQKSKYFP